jgi:hypothetical protein
MAKAKYKHRRSSPSTLRFSPYFSSRAGQLLSRLWTDLTMVSVFMLVFGAIFNLLVLLRSFSKFLSPEVSGVLAALNGIVVLIMLSVVGLAFIVCLGALFILSLHPRGRTLADKWFKFRDLTEMEELKIRVGNIEDSLGHIEVTLKSLAKKKTRKAKGE